MKKFLALTGVLLGMLATGTLWYRHSLSPPDPNNRTGVRVEIPSGMGVRGIAGLLRGHGIIRSAAVFTLYVRLHGAETGLQAGSFFLRPSLSVSEIIRILRRGFGDEFVITIPEGFTLRDIDALLAEKGITRPGEILECARTCDFAEYAFLPKSDERFLGRGGRLEGYLFPDTYFVTHDQFTPHSFLGRLLSTFRRRVVTGLQEDTSRSGKPLHDLITMASLVEEETRTDDERPLVSGILWKRHKAGMVLGVDAAVRYALGKPKVAITEADLETDSPYNLRKFPGLPPGPIANPGLESIRAALHPQVSSYWYYLHDGQGVIRYAVTNEEHNANRTKYLR